jgi:hypothetical protein
VEKRKHDPAQRLHDITPSTWALSTGATTLAASKSLVPVSPRLALGEKEKKERVGPVSAFAFIEGTQVLAKMPLSYGAFKPQGRQSEQ